MKTDQSSLEMMLSDIENREDRLTDWERGFIDSVGRRISSGAANLSEKQDITFTKIWERVTEL